MIVEVMRWSFVAIMLLAVVAASLYRRTGVMAQNSLSGIRPFGRPAAGGSGEFVELWRLAYSAALGGSAALRPFVRIEAPPLTARSAAADYRDALETPEFVRLPWVLAFLLCLLVVGFSSFVLVGPIEAAAGQLSSLLLGGETMQTATTDAAGFRTHQLAALFWIMTAFIGAYVWSIGYLLWRMAQRDVTGHVFNTVSVRMLVAGLMGAVLFHIFGGIEALGTTPLLLPLAAGLVPQWVLAWLLRKIQAMLQTEAEQQATLQLTLIEGIDELVAVRLGEAGVDGPQALATVNPVRLALQTPFSFRAVIDWIGQAQLLLHLKPGHYRELSGQGVRTAHDLLSLPDARRDALSAAAGLDLATVASSLAGDPSYLHYAEIVRRLSLTEAP